MLIIEKLRTSLYKHYINLLKQKDLPLDNYFGIRFEIHFAANLASKKVDFRKSEHPDFIMKGKYGIECTSLHLYLEIEDSPREVLTKLTEKIDEKNQKQYSSPITILALDITNLVYHEGRKPSLAILSDIDKARPPIINKIKDTQFSCLLYYCQSWTTDENNPDPNATLHSLWSRIDNPHINKSFKRCLDKIYPLGDIWIEANTGKIV